MVAGIDERYLALRKGARNAERRAPRETGLFGSKELQLAGVEGGQEFFEEETAEQPRENAHVQQSGLAGDPAPTVEQRGRPGRP